MIYLDPNIDCWLYGTELPAACNP